MLANVAPAVLDRLHGRLPPAGAGAPGHRGAGNPNHRREGAQVKVNLLLKRLPRLLDGAVSPEAAFGGTFHINETWSQLDAAYRTAAAGSVPSTAARAKSTATRSTDPSILSPELQAAGAQTLTVFGLHVPDRLITAENNEDRRAELQAAVLASLNSVLAEPIEDLLLTGPDGRPCIETKTTLDIERAVGMPRGNIFHGGLDWPFVEDGDAAGHPGAPLGRGDGRSADPALRLRRPPRRRRQRASADTTPPWPCWNPEPPLPGTWARDRRRVTGRGHAHEQPPPPAPARPGAAGARGWPCWWPRRSSWNSSTGPS